MVKQSVLLIAMFVLCLSSTGGAPSSTGTDQMPGQWGEFGKEYTIGGTSPMNFALISAEYSVAQVKIGKEVFCPLASEKFLVLHYTIHNPQKTAQQATFNTLRFTAVGASSDSYKYSEKVAQEKDSKPLNMSLKPAQKIEAYTYIRVAAEGVIPKLIVERGSNNPVVRFDLRDKIKPLTAPFADPADTTGSTALTEVPAQMDTYYPLGDNDLKVISASYTDQPVVKEKPAKGFRFMVVTVSIKNMDVKERKVGWKTFNPKLVAEDGEELKWKEALVHATRPEALIDVTAKPGQELQARFYFQVRTDTPAKTLSIREGSKGRVYVFDVSGVE